MASYLQQNFVFRPMTEEIVSSCQAFSCSKDGQIDRFFHVEYQDYEYQLLGKSYCFVSKYELKIAAAFTVAKDFLLVK